MKRLALLLAVSGLSALAQNRSFDVASVKPAAPPPGMHGEGGAVRMMMGQRFGPGTADPTRWACDNCTLMMLLTQAYNLKRFQISGPPWLDSERFDITARVPEGATKDDLREMQRTLLAERFGMKARIEPKEMQVYDLVVGSKGHKLKESTAAPVDPNAAPQMPGMGRGGPMQIKLGSDGFPDLPPGRTMTMNFNGNSKHQAVGEDMKQLTDMLSANLDKPVTDSTGLTGRYDFSLTFSGGSGRGGPGGGAMMVMMTRGGPGPGGGGGGGG
ncbi:MAG: hypothetical protein JWN34_1400, partial [Bryobacterales bacterium]|nr:hypothetical protein [Bryobacterales bacterium]